MTSATILMQRQAVTLNEAMELVREAKPDTERLDEVLAETFIGDEAKMVALIFELSEMAVRQQRAIDHLTEHITRGQDVEIERLAKRVEKLEKAGKPKPRTKTGKE